MSAFASWCASKIGGKKVDSSILDTAKPPQKYKDKGVTDADWKHLHDLRAVDLANEKAQAALQHFELTHDQPRLPRDYEELSKEEQAAADKAHEAAHAALKELSQPLEDEASRAAEALGNWGKGDKKAIAAILKIQEIFGSSVKRCDIAEFYGAHQIYGDDYDTASLHHDRRRRQHDRLQHDNIQSGYDAGSIPLDQSYGYHSPASLSYNDNNYNNEYLFMLIPSTIVIVVLFCLVCLVCLLVTHGVVAAIGYFYGEKVNKISSKRDEFALNNV